MGGKTNKTDENTKLGRQRGASTRSNKSTKSTGSYGAVEAGSRRGSTGSRVFLKRTGSTATTDKEFERPFPQVPSGKSLTSQMSRASIRTRLTSVSRSDYHDDLKTTLASGLNIKIIFTTFIIVFGSSFQFGYNIGVLNQPVHPWWGLISIDKGHLAVGLTARVYMTYLRQLIKDFYNQTYTERYGEISEMTLTILWSLTTAAFIPGGMLGAFLGGAIADKLGRKKSILLSHIFAFIGSGLSCACVAAKAPELIMLGRFFLGINSGIGNCLAPMFLSEIAPFNLRGAFGTVHQLSITIGIFLSSVFGIEQILGTAELWPFLILLEAIPAFVSLVILPCLPESPRYLLLVKGDRNTAEKSMQFYRNAADVSTDMEEMDTEHQESQSVLSADKEKEKDGFTLKKLFTTPDFRMPLFIACFLQVIQQFSGINAIFFYSSGIYKAAGVKATQIPYAVIGTNAVNVAMTIISVPLMDIAGRRLLLLVPMLVMVVDLILMTVGLNLKHEFFWMNYVTVACVIIYVICFAVGLGPIPMMIGAELFRQEPRALAMATAGVVNWIFTFIIALGFEALALACGDFTFLIFLILMIFFTLFVFFKVPETKNKTFEEIAHQFAPGPDLEVEEMIDDEDGVFDDADADIDADALPNDIGDQEDHRLVSFYLKGQKSQDGETPPGVVPPENIPLTNGNPTQAANGPTKGDSTMAIPPGVPYIDASPASERTNPSPSPLNPSKESLLAKTPEGDG